jgi:hypothetical protein
MNVQAASEGSSRDGTIRCGVSARSVAVTGWRVESSAVTVTGVPGWSPEGSEASCAGGACGSLARATSKAASHVASLLWPWPIAMIRSRHCLTRSNPASSDSSGSAGSRRSGGVAGVSGSSRGTAVEAAMNAR